MYRTKTHSPYEFHSDDLSCQEQLLQKKTHYWTLQNRQDNPSDPISDADHKSISPHRPTCQFYVHADKQSQVRSCFGRSYPAFWACYNILVGAPPPLPEWEVNWVKVGRHIFHLFLHSVPGPRRNIVKESQRFTFCYMKIIAVPWQYAIFCSSGNAIVESNKSTV